MKRNHLVLLGILALIIAGIVVGKNRQKQAQPLSSLYELITVKDTNEVGRIFLADRFGNQALLEREKDYWSYYNKAKDQRYPAAESSISLLLKSISEIRIRSKVPRNAEQTAVRELTGTSTKIEIYSKSGKMMQTYYIGHNGVNDIGSYTMIEGDDNVYLSFIPGEPGELLPRFSALERTWRDKKLFRYKSTPGQIKLEYLLPGQEQYSFEATYTKGQYELKPLNAQATYKPEQLQELLVKDYFALYASIGAESIIEDPYRRDSILLSSRPFCKISVIDSEGELRTAQFNALEVNPIRDDGTVSVRAQMQRFAVLVNDGEDVLLMQNKVVGKLFQSAGFFYGINDL